MPVSESQRRASNKYIKENMTILACKVRKDYADRVRSLCASRGESVNGVIKAALDKYLEDNSPISF